MNNFAISCCTTVDLKKEHLEARQIPSICFHYFLDGVQYDDDLEQTMTYKEFYDAMRAGADAKTSQVNAGEFEEYFEGFLKEGKDILHISLSSGISGAYNSANIARQVLEERYPDRKIYVLDSLAASSGYGMLVDQAVDLKEDGKTIDEVWDWLVKNRLRLQHWFFTQDLTYLVKGGRVSKAAGLVGSALSICPLMHVDREGRLAVRQKIRTKKKTIRALLEQMEQNADGGTAYNGRCYISHSDCMDDAEAVAAAIGERFPALAGKILINSVGTTIGSHTGPGVIAVFFWGTER